MRSPVFAVFKRLISSAIAVALMLTAPGPAAYAAVGAASRAAAVRVNIPATGMRLGAAPIRLSAPMRLESGLPSLKTIGLVKLQTIFETFANAAVSDSAFASVPVTAKIAAVSAEAKAATPAKAVIASAQSFTAERVESTGRETASQGWSASFRFWDRGGKRDSEGTPVASAGSFSGSLSRLLPHSPRVKIAARRSIEKIGAAAAPVVDKAEGFFGQLGLGSAFAGMSFGAGIGFVLSLSTFEMVLIGAGAGLLISMLLRRKKKDLPADPVDNSAVIEALLPAVSGVAKALEDDDVTLEPAEAAEFAVRKIAERRALLSEDSPAALILAAVEHHVAGIAPRMKTWSSAAGVVTGALTRAQSLLKDGWKPEEVSDKLLQGVANYEAAVAQRKKARKWLIPLALAWIGANALTFGTQAVVQGALMISLKLVPLVVIMPALILHELGHGYMADWLGDKTPRREKRLTLNPVSHISLMLTVLPMMLLGFGLAKPVPVSLKKLNTRRDIFLMAAAGPGVNFILAGLSAGLIFALTAMTGVPAIWPLSIFADFGGFLAAATAAQMASVALSMFFMVNVGLGLFNLIPLLPADGGRIFSALLLPQKWALWANTNGKVQMIGFGLLLYLIFAQGELVGKVLFTAILWVMSMVFPGLTAFVPIG